MKKIRSQNGSSAALVSIGLAVSLSLFAGAYAVLKSNEAMKGQSDVRFAAQLIQHNFVALMSDDRAWYYTMKDPRNAKMQCFDADPTTCDPNLNEPLTLIGSSGQVMFDPTQSQLGFNLAGKRCSLASLDPRVVCPFQVMLSWKPKCADGSAVCANQKPVIDFNLTFRPPRFIAPFNSDRFSLHELFRPDDYLGLIQKNCAAMHGTFNPATGRCQYDYFKDCPPGQYVSAITPNGPICKSMLIDKCPKDHIMTGVSGDRRSLQCMSGLF